MMPVAVSFNEEQSRLAFRIAPPKGNILLERLYLEDLMGTHDATEGVQAFIEKRAPKVARPLTALRSANERSQQKDELMLFNVEIVLRERDYAVTEQVHHVGNEPAAWTEADVEGVLKSMLLAIDRVKNPGVEPPQVRLRGFSWIVEPTSEGVVIAMEITSGAAVAGPFEIEQSRLDRLITSVLESARGPRPVVH